MSVTQLDDDVPRALARYLHEHMPLTRALGVSVLAAGQQGVNLAAPLAANINHQSTAFGGSLASLAILAGWSWVWVHLRAGGSKAAWMGGSGAGGRRWRRCGGRNWGCGTPTRPSWTSGGALREPRRRRAPRCRQRPFVPLRTA